MLLINQSLIYFKIQMYEIIIIGGGLAGLVSSIQLAKAGRKVLLIEKKKYPFHKVCGEYISNETRPFLESLGVNFEDLGVKEITKFQFTSPSGRVLETDLDLGGFGISRYKLDEYLFHLAEENGVEFLLENLLNQMDKLYLNQFQIFLSLGKELKILVNSHAKI